MIWLLLTLPSALSPYSCISASPLFLLAHPGCAQSCSRTKLLVMSWLCSIISPQNFCMRFCLSGTSPSANSYLFFRFLLRDYFPQWLFPDTCLPELTVFSCVLLRHPPLTCHLLTYLISWSISCSRIRLVSALFTAVSPTPSTGLTHSKYSKDLLNEWLVAIHGIVLALTPISTWTLLWTPTPPRILSPKINEEVSPLSF